MGWQAWVTIGIVLLVVGLLTFGRIAPDLVMLGAVTLLLTFGVVNEKDALGGFANEGMLTVAILFVVAAGVRETGAMAVLAQRVLGQPEVNHCGAGTYDVPDGSDECLHEQHAARRYYAPPRR